jgi:hypothetical protein
MAACVYIAWTAIVLYRSTGVYRDMFASMGIQLPGTTHFIIHNYQWYYPCLFGTMATLVIVKQFFMREKWKNVALSLLAVVLADLAANGAVQALYRPLLEMIEKLNK